MNKTAKKPVSKARIAVIILAAVFVAFRIISYVVFWCNIAHYPYVWDSSSIINNVFNTITDVLMPALLLICAIFFFDKKQGSVLMAILFALLAVLILYNNWYKIQELFNGLWTFDVIDIFNIIKFILFVLCMFSALNGFKRKWVIIAATALVMVVSTYFSLNSLISHFLHDQTYFDNDFTSFNVWSIIESILQGLVFLTALLLYGLFCHNPSVADVWTAIWFSLRTRKSRREIRECEEDLSELKHYRKQGMITPEEYKERTAPIIEKRKALKISVDEYAAKVGKVRK